VGLARSPYYVDKFLGLGAQFGEGCEVVLLDDARLEETLGAAVRRAWDAAPGWRPRLLEAAGRQVEQSRAAYERLRELVGD